MSDKPSNVIEAIAWVSGQVDAIAKEKTANAGGTFKYRGIEDVLKALHDPLAEAGVVIVPRVTRADVVKHEVVRASGKTALDFEAQMLIEYRIYGPGGREDYIDAAMFATGFDSGDKGTGKAMSYAYKQLAFQLFCIPTDASVDNEAENVVREARTAQRRAEPAPEDFLGWPSEEKHDEWWTTVSAGLKALPQEQRDGAVADLTKGGYFESRRPKLPFNSFAAPFVGEIVERWSAKSEAVTAPAQRPQHAIDTLADARDCDPLTAEGIEEWHWELASHANPDEIPWKSYAGKDRTGLRMQAILDKARELASDLTVKGITTDVPDRLDDIHGELAVALRLALLAYDPSEPF